jgi:hypothetical protein
MGIKELKEALALAFGLGNVIKNATADGKVDFSDAVYLMELIPLLAPAVEGADQIPGELKDLDEAERVELMSFVKEKFDLEDDALEGKIEAGLELVSKIFLFVKGL